MSSAAKSSFAITEIHQPFTNCTSVNRLIAVFIAVDQSPSLSRDRAFFYLCHEVIAAISPFRYLCKKPHFRHSLSECESDRRFVAVVLRDRQPEFSYFRFDGINE